MNKLALAVAFAVCQPGVILAQSCENGTCRLNRSDNTFATGTAPVCAYGRCRGFDCDCVNQGQTDQRVRDSRFQAPAPGIFRGRGTIGRRARPVSGSVNSNQSTKFQWPAGSLYRPVAYKAANVKWNSNIREAAAIARQTGRPMLIRVSAEWCGYCQQMKRGTFADSRVVRDISQNFVAVDLDADTNRSIVKQLRITSLPTVLVVAPDLRILAREEGFRTAVQIGQLMHRHMQRAQLDTGVRVASR